MGADATTVLPVVGADSEGTPVAATVARVVNCLAGEFTLPA